MDRKEVAKKIREAIFNRIEEDRAIHASSLDEEIEKGLASMQMHFDCETMASYPGFLGKRWPARGESAPIPVSSGEIMPLPFLDYADWVPNVGLDVIAASTPAEARSPIPAAVKEAFSLWRTFSWEPEVLRILSGTEAQVDIITHPEAADK